MTIFSMSFAACGDDDDEPKSSLAGTSWQIISDSDDDELIGMVITFNKDGKCTFTNTTVGWSYSRWSQKEGKLKLILGEDEPDDYMEGTFVINGADATFTYSWYDCDGKWGGERTNVMKLRKK